MHEGYELREGPPPVEDFIRLRREAGLTVPTLEQARAGIDGGWFAVHVVDTATREPVGVGRVIGDGGWYFHVTDMATAPAHQRRGIGAAILSALVARIERDAPPGAIINLIADPPGVGLYTRHGFLPTGEEIGMWLPTSGANAASGSVPADG